MPDVPFFRKAKYSPGDGMGFGLGSHTLDQALQLFGTPKCVTGFLRVLRDFKSEVEDTYTVLLQYENPLLVTIKSTIISSMQHQLKYFFRGTQGSFVKYDTDAQENQILSGMKPTEDNFAFDTEDQWGVLTTRERFESGTIDQSYDRKQSQWTGRYKTFRGWCQGFYNNVADVIKRIAEPMVRARQSRDVVRLLELVRESSHKGCTIPWSSR